MASNFQGATCKAKARTRWALYSLWTSVWWRQKQHNSWSVGKP